MMVTIVTPGIKRSAMMKRLEILIGSVGAGGAAALMALATGLTTTAMVTVAHMMLTGQLSGPVEALVCAVVVALLVFVCVRPIFAMVGAQLDKEKGLEASLRELRQMQARLRESEDRFRNIAEAASDWFWEMDANLRFTYFSPRAEQIVGVPTEFHIGKTRAELAGEDITTEKWRRHIEDLENHRPFRDFRFIREGHDGRLQHLTTSGKPVFGEDGAFKGYIGVGSDLTQQVEAEEKAKIATERLATAVEGLSELFVLWGPDDRLVVCNEQFRRINEPVIETMAPGTLFADHIRAALDKGLYPGAKGREEEWFADRLSQHADPPGPFELERQDGQWLLIREQRLPDGSTATISTDITLLKKNEMALRAAKDLAEEANRSKSEFLARMSHELRTPLNAILGFSHVIRDQALGPAETIRYADYADDIHASGQMLLSLINDLLDLSKIEAGKYEIADEQIDLEETVDAVHRLFAGQAEATRLRLSASLPTGLPRLRADQRAVKQAIMNLVSNAVKFTPAGGSVSIGAAVENGAMEITVTDDGIGFDLKHLDTILAPFGRIGDPGTHSVNGTGLGLAIVKSLMDMHGGDVRLVSAPGNGTSATLRFQAERVGPAN
ncbi:MAG: ATP-binding protein [Magnetovibrio sp.]|nr:ATP-binding protein [Magnetovibrio sp.]